MVLHETATCIYTFLLLFLAMKTAVAIVLGALVATALADGKFCCITKIC